MCQGIVNEPVQYAVKCVGCKRTYALTVEATHLFTYMYTPRQDRPLIQELFTDRTGMPYLSADERELLVSRTCGPCFDSLFSTEGSDTRECDECGRVTDAGDYPDWVNGVCEDCDPSLLEQQ